MLARALSAAGEVRPQGAGWKTLKEMGVIWKLVGTGAATRAGRLYRAGLLEKFPGKQLLNGKLVHCVWYRPKP